MKFHKKPVVIEAVQWVGDPFPEFDTVLNWANAAGLTLSISRQHLFIDTLEGTMEAQIGDWIIRDVKGDLYFCQPDIFDATYEAILDEERPA